MIIILFFGLSDKLAYLLPLCKWSGGGKGLRSKSANVRALEGPRGLVEGALGLR